MRFSALFTLFLVVIYLTEGRTYGYGRRKKVVRSRVKKPYIKPKVFVPRHKMRFHKKSDPCPPIDCQPDEVCLKKTYFMKDGVKCQGCEKNKCISKRKLFDKKWKMRNIKNVVKDKRKHIPPRGVKIQEVPIPVNVPVKEPVEVPFHNNGPIPGSPIDGRFPGFPIDGVVPDSPINDRFPGSPIDGPVPGSTTDGRFPGSPIDGRLVPGSPIDGPIPGPAIDGPVPGSPIGSLPVDSVGPFDVPNPNLQSQFPLNPSQGSGPDPVAIVNSPPTDNEFVNRLRFDQNNIGLLQPPLEGTSATDFQSSFTNQGTFQQPFQQNAANQFQNQQSLNPWFSQGFMNPNLQNTNQNRAMLWWQNQMAQLQAQQAAASQFQGTQSWNQFQSQQPVVSGGIPQNTQGFPNWGNANPFLGFQPGINPNNQMQGAPWMNQIPPVPGMNTNFQGQATQAANNWAAGGGFVNPGQTQNTQSLSLIDPVTNQALTGGANSLHGPITS